MRLRVLGVGLGLMIGLFGCAGPASDSPRAESVSAETHGAAGATQPGAESGGRVLPYAKEFDGLPLLLVDEMDARSAPRWQPTDPQAWRFEQDGPLSVYSQFRQSKYEPPVRSPFNIALLADVWVSDFVLDVWLRSTARDYNHRDMCVVFGHEDPAHFYYVHFGLKADAHSNSIMIVNGAPRVSIARTRTDGTRWTEAYHHVRVVRRTKSGDIRVYFDDMDTPAMTAEDTTFAWGRVGVGTFDDTGNVDRVVLWGRRLTPATTRALGAATRPTSQPAR